MLVVAGGDRTRLDTGSVALALARRLGESDRKALFVDADATGSRLARRCGQALGAPFSPATRGLPTLIAARDPMRVDALAAHCYSLSAGPESLWLLFAPESAAGGRVAAGWLAERAAELRELDRTRRVVVSVPSWQQYDTVLPLLKSASTLIHHQRLTNKGAAEALLRRLGSVGLSGAGMRPGVLLVEEQSPLEDGPLQMTTGLRVIGRLPFVADEKVLRMRFRGRDAAFGVSLDGVVSVLAGDGDVAGGTVGSVTALPQSRLVAGPVAPAADRPPRLSRQRRTRDVSA